MKAVAHAGVFLRRLYDSDAAIAEVVSGDRAVQNPERLDFTAVQTDELVAVLCFSAVSIVHSIIYLVRVADEDR